jgi:hypothetical protein
MRYISSPHGIDRVHERIYIGGKIGPGRQVVLCDVLALCAYELQEGIDGVETVYAPIDDAELSEREALTVMAASSKLANHHARGQTLVITCQMGANRSALTAALTLMRVTGRGPAEVIEQIRAHRFPPPPFFPLQNRSFDFFLRTLRTLPAPVYRRRSP